MVQPWGNAFYDIHTDGFIQFTAGKIIQKEQRFAPVVITSFTHMATRSMPTVSCLFIMKAIF